MQQLLHRPVIPDVAKFLQNAAKINAKLNAFVCLVDEESLRAQQRRLQEAESPGKLFGLTVGVKDNIHVAGHATTCASNMLRNFNPTWSALCVEALKREGSLILGKTNMDEFGMGSHSTQSIFGPVVNPSFLNDEGMRISAGGSSGGSAAAVAAGLCDVALGSDTGGSVRLPAAYCHIFGFKPSYGRISRHGLVSYASSLDTIGILGGTVKIVSRTFDVLKETGGNGDMTSWRRTSAPHTSKATRLRVLVPNNVCSDYIRGTLDEIDNTGALIKQSKHINGFADALVVYYTIAMVEAASCLARYPLKFFPPPQVASFGPAVSERIKLGQWISSQAQSSTLYQWALERRRLLEDEIGALFQNEEFDLIAMPTITTSPPTLEQVRASEEELVDEEKEFNRWREILRAIDVTSSRRIDNEMLSEALQVDLLTVPASLARVPAITLPQSGLQLMMPFGQDEELLTVAGQLVQRL